MVDPHTDPRCLFSEEVDRSNQRLICRNRLDESYLGDKCWMGGGCNPLSRLMAMLGRRHICSRPIPAHSRTCIFVHSHTHNQDLDIPFFVFGWNGGVSAPFVAYIGHRVLFASRCLSVPHPKTDVAKVLRNILRIPGPLQQILKKMKAFAQVC